jgi:hypothetical protein
VLHEAFAGSARLDPESVTRVLEVKRDIGLFRRRQYLKCTEVDGAVYFTEGNGEPALNSTKTAD